MMYYADAAGVTLRVSVELAELHSALLNLPVLRSKLNDDSVPAKAHIDLLNAVLGKTEFNEVTLRLAEHAACNPRNRRYLETIQWLSTSSRATWASR